MLDYKDYSVLCDMEILVYNLLEKNVEKTYNEEGECNNKEWELWNKYYNVVEKVMRYFDRLEETKKEIKEREDDR